MAGCAGVAGSVYVGTAAALVVVSSVDFAVTSAAGSVVLRVGVFPFLVTRVQSSSGLSW